MPTGSCFCGNLKISYDGEPEMKALCHCADCQKISGSAFSTNVIVSDKGFKYTSGTPKTIGKTADSGKKIVSSFCPDCGTTLSRVSESMPGKVIIKAGTLDGQMDAAKPMAELFAPGRVSWVQEIPGTKQVETMPSA